MLLDDLGFSDYGYMGGDIRTPNIDALARGGTTLTQFYVSPRCSPTRASLLTGRYPHQVGLAFLTTPADSNPPRGPYQGYLSEDSITLAEALRTAGYRTYMSGKWHLGESEEHWPVTRGFDEYFGLISGASSYYEIIRDQPRRRRMAINDSEWEPPADGFYMTNAISDQAVSYIDGHHANHDNEPLFLYLAYTAPHWPLHAPENVVEEYQGAYDAGPEAVMGARAEHSDVLSNPQLAAEPGASHWTEYNEEERILSADRMEVYAAMVDIADRGIGRVLDALRAHDALDNTLVLVFSDNGACAESVVQRGLHQEGIPVGDRGSYLAYDPHWAAVSNTPLRSYKGTTYEGGIRTPLIVHWPDFWEHRGWQAVRAAST